MSNFRLYCCSVVGFLLSHNAVNESCYVAQFFNSRNAPDTAGYPANPKAGYRISGKGRISSRIPVLDLTTTFLVNIKLIYKTALSIIDF
jgi:hypothetical protein